ncbi:MAG: PAS domain-containing protein, partial [Acetobacteraceae bacterium]|nr:PAS domain-containing protein [Acetobacteraceae bacterium]
TDVTAEREAEAALRDSEERLRLAVEATELGSWDEDMLAGRARWNAQAFRIMGLEPLDEPVPPETWSGRVHPEDLDRVRAACAAALLGGTLYRCEHRIIRPDGELRWVDPLGRFITDEQGQPLRFVGVFTDVTERKRAEAALAETEARFRTLIEAMPQIGFVIARDGRVEFLSARWQEFSGLPVDSSIGLGWQQALHPDDSAATDDAWTRARDTNGTFELEHRLRRGADGAWRWFLVRGVPLTRDAAGEVTRWFGTSTDITEIVDARESAARQAEELERQVAARTRALVDAARELALEMRRREEAQAALLQAQKLEALGQLTGGVAHDFNNVLAAIAGSYRLIRRQPELGPKVLELITLGERATERATRLIQQLLAFARKEELAPVVIEPAAVLRAAEDMIRHTATGRLDCVLDLAEDAWPVIADRVRLETVLLNLVANARDASSDGGRLTVSARNALPEELPADLPPMRGFLRIAVEDTGHGMDADTLRRATEPFFTTKPRGRGTGLGLASAHGFAAQSGGALRLLSAPGKGTTVELFLPRAAMVTGGGPLRPDSRAEADEAVLDPARHGGGTILVVDDDDGVRPVTAAFLRRLGYRVVEAPSAEAAEALAHAHADTIDMLVTDVVMAGASGPTLAARLRAEWPGLPVLYITGFAGGAALDDAPVLRKPFPEAALARAVSEGLRHARAPAGIG